MINGTPINLKSSPIAIAEIDKICHTFIKPYLPVCHDRYLINVKIVLKDRSVIVLDGAEWIHPEGISMGMVSIATERFMVWKPRISSISVMAKKEKEFAGLAISLTDGGKFILFEGVYKARAARGRKKGTSI